MPDGEQTQISALQHSHNNNEQQSKAKQSTMLSKPSRVALLLVRRGGNNQGRNLFTTVASASSRTATTTSTTLRPMIASSNSLERSSCSPPRQHSAVQHYQHYKYYHSTGGRFENTNRIADAPPAGDAELPGSKAFLECDRAAVIDLFHKYSVYCDDDGDHLNKEGLRQILQAVGENQDEDTLDRLYEAADLDGNGVIELNVSSVRYLEEGTRSFVRAKDSISVPLVFACFS
jgi:hypothetical protein